MNAEIILMTASHQVSQDVVVALCILALFDNLENKDRRERK